MRRTFKTRHFHRWMRKTELTDAALCKAVAEAATGLIDADLGGGVIKKRIALPGQGKSGGTRTLIATYKAGRWFFVYGFEKSERANISQAELQGLQALATDLLHLTSNELEAAVKIGELMEICHEH